MPAPILAELLGATDSSTVSWARLAASDWRTDPAAGPEMRRRYDDLHRARTSR